MAANIFPKKEFISEMPYSESKVYDLLSGLSSSFAIFYSVRWSKRSKKWKTTWKENDFLIFNRKLGALVLEVKGGDISYKDCVFIQKNKQTGETKILSPEKKNDPLSQAIDGIYHYRNVIDEIADDLDNRFPIEAAIWMPGTAVEERINSFPLPYREIKEAVLGLSELEKGPQTIYDVFDAYNNRAKVNITDEEYEKIIAKIATDFELVEARPFKIDEMSDAFFRLTDEQTGLLDYISEQNIATIQGVAATGKTMIAKEAAKKFADKERKVLYLCFNKFLRYDLEHRFQYEGVTYMNIHQFINEYGNQDRIDLSDINDRARILQQIEWDDLDYDDVIIDEAQDFLNDEVVYFKNYVELKEGHFLVFYDKNQLLTTSEVPEWITNAECKLLLTRNCRNTYEIALSAYNVIGVELKQQIQMIKGEQPIITFVKGEPQIKLGKLIKYYLDEKEGYRPEQIAVLSLKSESNSIIKQDAKKIGGVPIVRESNNSAVFFTTASKFKGLEKEVVIIVDIDKSCFEKPEKMRDFYVACSRATQRLAFFINGNEEDVKAMADAISKTRFAPEGKIAMKTKAHIEVFD